MAGAHIQIHDRFASDFGPVSKYVPPAMEIQEAADPGGGKPNEPNALVFVDPRDGETHVFVMSEATRHAVVRILTGGVVLPGGVAE